MKKMITYTLISLLVIASTSATLTITRESMPRPTITKLELLPGGSLEPDTTYYYRVATADNYFLGNAQKVSPLSDVKNITTNATHRSVNISIDTGTGSPEYVYIWVAVNKSVPKGHWFDEENYGSYLWYLGTGSMNHYSTGYTTKIDSYVDDGSIGYTNIIYQLSGANYAYAYPREDGADYINAYSDNLSEPVTLQSIWDYAQANGWNPNSTIQKLSSWRDGVENTNVPPTFKLNAARMVISGYAATTFQSDNENIILDACDLIIYSDAEIGDYDATNDMTTNGDKIVMTGHGVTFGSVTFGATAGGENNVYDTTFIARRTKGSHAVDYGANVYISSNDWHFIDSGLGGRKTATESDGFDRGFYVSNAATDGSSGFKRCYTKSNRWENNIRTATPFLMDDFTIYLKSNSGLWVLHSDDQERTLTGVKMVGTPVNEMYASVWDGTSSGLRTELNLVDSYLEHPELIYWYAPQAGVEKSYVKFSYTLNVHVNGKDGNPLGGVNVTLTDKNGNVVFSTLTNTTGDITPTVVTSQVYKPNLALGSHHQDPAYITDYNPFTLTLAKKGIMSYQTTLDINQPINAEYTLKNPETILLQNGGGVVIA